MIWKKEVDKHYGLMRNIMRPKEGKCEGNMKKLLFLFIVFAFFGETLFAGAKNSLETENKALTNEINQLKHEVSSLEFETLKKLKNEKQTKTDQYNSFQGHISDYQNDIYKKNEEIVKKKKDNQEFGDSLDQTFREKLENVKLELSSAKELNQSLSINLDDFKNKLATTESEIDKLLKENSIIEATK